jgi:hypothetical protein
MRVRRFVQLPLSLHSRRQRPVQGMPIGHTCDVTQRRNSPATIRCQMQALHQLRPPPRRSRLLRPPSNNQLLHLQGRSRAGPSGA